MNKALPSLIVSKNTSIRDVMREFEGSNNDLLLIDERTVIADPHLELLTDYPEVLTPH